MKTFPDGKIIDYLRSGEAEKREHAFRQLYRNYYGLIESLVLKNSGGVGDVTSVFHDGLIVLEQKLLDPDFKLTCALKTYLYSICRFKWLEELRRRKRHVTDDLTEVSDFIDLNENALEKVLRGERTEKLIRVFQRMKEDCRKVLLHAFYFKCSREKIARIMGYANAQVAKNKVNRCRRSFVQLYLEEAGE